LHLTDLERAGAYYGASGERFQESAPFSMLWAAWRRIGSYDRIDLTTCKERVSLGGGEPGNEG
jgi:hypothetical protein